MLNTWSYWYMQYLQVLCAIIFILYNFLISIATVIVVVYSNNNCIITILSQNGHTPLHWALQYGFNEIVHYFVKVCKQNMNVKWFSEVSVTPLYTKCLSVQKNLNCLNH